MTATGIATSDIYATSGPMGCLSLRAGEVVTILAFDTDSPEYVWCTTNSGDGGWVPTSQLMLGENRKPVASKASTPSRWQGRPMPALASLWKAVAMDSSLKSSARRMLVSILEGASHGKQVLVARPYFYAIITSLALFTGFLDLR